MSGENLRATAKRRYRREVDRRGRAFVTAMKIYVIRGIVCEGSRQRLRSARRNIPRSIDATPSEIAFFA